MRLCQWSASGTFNFKLNLTLKFKLLTATQPLDSGELGVQGFKLLVYFCPAALAVPLAVSPY